MFYKHYIAYKNKIVDDVLANFTILWIVLDYEKIRVINNQFK